MKGKLVGRDPRTVAREISGVFEKVFPYLIPGIVANINRLSMPVPGLQLVPPQLMLESRLQKAMLFEVAMVVAESRLKGEVFPGWDQMLVRATNKQRFFYDADLPLTLSEPDRKVATMVAEGLVHSLNYYAVLKGVDFGGLKISPKIPGFNWIASGVGDFSLGDSLIEVKCSGKNFSSADYRQVLMYWILSYLYALETGAEYWRVCVIINPRLNRMLEIDFDDLLGFMSPWGSKIELLEAFRASIDISPD
ncbi:hypothetical protein [Pseudomonas sp. USHLN015]|uniref:hypothetical protein n=1 Tax=Pseudomonas sp. USHLN015 TaxID=3081296 RepID=UPI00301B9A62